MFTDDYPPVLATQSELWRRTTLWSRWWFEFVRLNQWFEHLECFRGDSASETRCCCFSPSLGAPHYCCCLFLCCYCCWCWCCCCSCCSFPCPWSWGIQPMPMVSLSWRRQFFCSTSFWPKSDLNSSLPFNKSAGLPKSNMAISAEIYFFLVKQIWYFAPKEEDFKKSSPSHVRAVLGHLSTPWLRAGHPPCLDH